MVDPTTNTSLLCISATLIPEPGMHGRSGTDPSGSVFLWRRQMPTEETIWERDRLLEALDSYQKGLSDPPYVQKWANSRTQSTGAGDRMTFVVSTDEVDRQGDTIAVDGWRVDAYMRNPVFLWAHNYTRPAIGRAVSVWREGHGLLARIEFAPTDFAQEIRRLYDSGYQHGVSVGFRPLKYALRRETGTGEFRGIDFIEQELLEISAAPVPANAHALKKALADAPIMHAYFSRSASWDLPQELAAPTRGPNIEELLAVLRGAMGRPEG
jgi:HK97 family phage prohead protease